MCDRVGGVERVVAEVPVDGARQVVRARFRNGLHLNARRASLGDVEIARHDLEFGNRFAAEARLARSRAEHVLFDLLAIEVQIERLVLADARRVRHVVRGDALHEQRQLQPVAALQWHGFHLAAVDVARHLCGVEIHERRFAFHRDAFLDTGDFAS